ncbi:hypothetical protein LPTSP4_11760 [Leptospira ryugenii]|uniref:Uncharacterized protein n=1 Tax=Leptospira ryugenii TaxID=1917863 RepID=A0A2P2DYI3_9LEPT|nr:hypothetical protein [Leptospira ryugenii]GBF49660.1 hypothetical protein LPTSP4_11760 [Leptospira ryugenii]
MSVDFSHLDEALLERHPERKSLCPGREKASSFVSLAKSFEQFDFTIEEKETIQECFSQIIFTAMEHFPENIFWDFDFVFYQMLVDSNKSEQGVKGYWIEFSKRIGDIFCTFGIQSKIKFRYIHDWLYGYDWLKWTLEKKREAEDPSPLGIPFLSYIRDRGLGLLELIDRDDRNYPDLGGVFRNPFFFSRSKEEEILLHTSLSSSAYIPIEAWKSKAFPRCDRNYSLLRLERAKELNLLPNDLPGSHKI